VVFVSQNALEKQIEAFKEALRAEYEARIASERRSMEEEIEERIAERRRQVEKQVALLRQEIASEKARRLSMRKQFLLQELRDKVTLWGEELLNAVEEKIATRLKEEGPFGSGAGSLEPLVIEALSVAGTPCIVSVPPGAGKNFSSRPEIVEVREEIDDSWGGCTVYSALDKRIFVENTLRTRWRRCRAEVGRELGRVLIPFFEEVDRIFRELRLS
jgi:vacuolar-type H+-ATPase subunit E/Vma4